MRTHQVFPGARITNDLCLWMEQERTIAIADLHIGLESALEADGVHLPRIQTDTMKESLLRILDRYRPERVVILGDLKHEFSRNLGQELSEVRQVLSLIKDGAEVCVARGNHDNYLPAIAFKLGIDVEDSFRFAGISFMHGHLPTEHRPLVIGHEHPSVRVFDQVGAYVKMPCFLSFEEERILVLPAFSPLVPGSDFTQGRSRAMSPVLDGLELGRAKVFACSEIGLLPLGQLADLERVKMGRTGSQYYHLVRSIARSTRGGQKSFLKVRHKGGISCHQGTNVSTNRSNGTRRTRRTMISSVRSPASWGSVPWTISAGTA